VFISQESEDTLLWMYQGNHDMENSQ